MATLPTDYQDDILDTSQNTNRKYEVVNNPDGTISLIDRTVYIQQGSQLGAQDVNNQNEEITNLTQSLTASNSQGFKFDYDSQSGKYGYVVSEGGADTFFPFSGALTIETLTMQGPTINIPVDASRLKGCIVSAFGAEYNWWDACIYLRDSNGNEILNYFVAFRVGAGQGGASKGVFTLNGNTLTCTANVGVALTVRLLY